MIYGPRRGAHRERRGRGHVHAQALGRESAPLHPLSPPHVALYVHVLVPARRARTANAQAGTSLTTRIPSREAPTARPRQLAWRGRAKKSLIMPTCRVRTAAGAHTRTHWQVAHAHPAAAPVASRPLNAWKEQHTQARAHPAAEEACLYTKRELTLEDDAEELAALRKWHVCRVE